MTSDLSRTKFPTEFHTIKVHNFKDDIYAEAATLHGVFTDKAEAERVAREFALDYLDFLTVEVIRIHFGTISQVAQAHGITHIEPATDEPSDQIREV